MAVLFAKLENMLQNSVYVNFLLTGLVAQLACHPQPLLRSFLLNTNMVFQPSVKSLLQVLGSVKNKIESFAASQEDFPALLSKAKKYLIARGKLDWAEGPAAVPVPRRSDPLDGTCTYQRKCKKAPCKEVWPYCSISILLAFWHAQTHMPAMFLRPSELGFKLWSAMWDLAVYA